MKRLKKIWFVALGTIFVISAVTGNFFYNIAISKKAFSGNVTSQEKSKIKIDYRHDYFDANSKEVSMKSITGVNLKGYEFVVDKSKPWIVVVHGYTSKARSMGHYIVEFNKMGYNVLAPDLMAHGKSEGDFISMGGYDSKDVRKWIDFLNEKYKNPSIMLFGVSMGAATVINTIDEDLPNNVKGFIEDSGYLKLSDEMSQQLKKLYKLPSFPIVPIASMTTKIRAGYFFSEVDATDGLKNTKLPALILHGDIDTFVLTENAQKIYDLVSSPKMIHISKGAKHLEGATIDHDDYWKIVKVFLNKYFAN